MPSIDALVGRDAEAAELARAVERLSAGRSTVLAIEGEAGIGKSALVRCMVDDARARGLLVLQGGGHPFGSARPFDLLDTALHLRRGPGDHRRTTIRDLRSDPAAADVQYRIIEEIVDLVEVTCADGPVLLVAEDIHWADAASVSAIAALARQLSLSPLLLVVTARPAPLSVEAARLLEELGSCGGSTIVLGPLSPDEVSLLAGSVLGCAPGPELCALLTKTGGNPLWAVAMVRALLDEGLLRRTPGGMEPTTSELPASLSALVTRRLRTVPKATRDLLQIAAVLGDAVPLQTLTTVATRPPVEVAEQLGPAFEAQLLDRTAGNVVFRHQLVQESIYQHVPAPTRRLLHRKAASTLTAAGADVIDVATHLVRSAEHGDVEAAESLRVAAGDVGLRAPDVAVELLRRACDVLPDDHRDADQLVLELVEALLRAGQVEEASTRAADALARPHRTQVDPGLRLVLLGALALQNRAAEVIAVADAALADVAGVGDHEQVSILAQQSWALTYSGAPEAGESAASRGLAIAERSGDAGAPLTVLPALVVAAGRRGRFHDALAHAERFVALSVQSLGRMALPVRPSFFLGLARFDCDLVTEARAAYRDTLDDEFGSGWWLSDTLMADAVAAFALGEWDDAQPRLIAGEHAAREKHHPLLASQSLAYQTVIATATGGHATASKLAARLPQQPRDEPPIYNAGVIAFARSGWKASVGDRAGAYDELHRCWLSDVAAGNRYYHRLLAPDLVRLALAGGFRDVAEAVSAALDDSAALAPGVASVQSVALRARALVEGRPDDAVEAVTIARTTPLLVDHAGACEDAAQLLVATGHGTDATAMLAEALDLYERAGATAWAARVRSRLRDLGVRPGTRGPRSRPLRGWESLTTTERAVAQLVAEGLTNNAVARRLYISPHTVNTHLRHIFGKLDVRNRVALASVVHRTVE